MKKGLLISAGTIGGLGSALFINNPSFADSSTPSPTKSPSASTSGTFETTVKARVKSKVRANAKAPMSSAQKNINGKFAGNVVDVGYGNVQVMIVVTSGVITEVKALQAPGGKRSRPYSEYALPILVQETLQAQSAKIDGVSGASYTSWGWTTSLQAALTKAGL